MTDGNDSTNVIQLLHSNYRSHPGFEVINKEGWKLVLTRTIVCFEMKKLTDPQRTVQTCNTPWLKVARVLLFRMEL